MTLAAKHRENIKNPAFTNPAFTAASQFARITKSGSVKFGNYTGGKTPCLKIPKIQQVTLPEFLNPALPNCRTYTGGKTPW
jgi:hypothetical protein